MKKAPVKKPRFGATDQLSDSLNNQPTEWHTGLYRLVYVIKKYLPVVCYQKKLTILKSPHLGTETFWGQIDEHSTDALDAPNVISICWWFLASRWSVQMKKKFQWFAKQDN